MAGINYDPTIVGGGGGGMFGGGGSIVEGLILGALLGNGGLGGGNRHDDTCAQFAATNSNITNGNYTLSSELANASNFTNAAVQAGNYMLSSEIGNGLNAATTQSAMQTDRITSEIISSNNDITNAVNAGTYSGVVNSLNSKYDIGMAMAAAAAQSAACCCETQKAIAGVNLNIVETKYQAEIANEARFNALSKQGTCETNSILSKLCSMELNAAQDEIAELRAERNVAHCVKGNDTINIINQVAAATATQIAGILKV